MGTLHAHTMTSAPERGRLPCGALGPMAFPEVITTVIGIGSGRTLGRIGTQLGIDGPLCTTVRDVGGFN